MKRSIRILCFAILMPAMPLWGQQGSVLVDGKEWLQPLDFTGYTYAQVNAVCPGGACSGALPGSTFDLTGFTWASVSDVSTLLNAYVSPPFTAPFQEREADASNFYDDFRSRHFSPGMGSGFPILAGMIRDIAPSQDEEGLDRAYVSGALGDRSFYNPAGPDELVTTLTSFAHELRGVWFWSSGAANLAGEVETEDGVSVCAMVLASGQYMFSCDPVGLYTLNDLPREPDGTVTRQIYADGFLPSVTVLQGSVTETVILQPADYCPDYNLPSNPGMFPGSAGNQHSVSGRVLDRNTEDPICAMVLANGEYVFSCDGSGNYALDFPLDGNGQYQLQVYADGFAPSIQTFDEMNSGGDVRMARLWDCQLNELD